jgi:hypothetical protein
MIDDSTVSFPFVVYISLSQSGLGDEGDEEEEESDGGEGPMDRCLWTTDSEVNRTGKPCAARFCSR